MVNFYSRIVKPFHFELVSKASGMLKRSMVLADSIFNFLFLISTANERQQLILNLYSYSTTELFPVRCHPLTFYSGVFSCNWRHKHYSKIIVFINLGYSIKSVFYTRTTFASLRKVFRQCFFKTLASSH